MSRNFLSSKVSRIHREPQEAPRKRRRRREEDDAAEEEARDRSRLSVDELLQLATEANLRSSQKKRLAREHAGVASGLKEGQRVPLPILLGMKRKQKAREEAKKARALELSDGVLLVKKKKRQRYEGERDLSAQQRMEKRGLQVQRGVTKGGVLYVSKHRVSQIDRASQRKKRRQKKI